ncbi:hypothetical protein I7I53_06598 [Histoplasma capsulatum var. duboisii H88]|uniref:Secreted protein n=1 Tax=Ajellomyces capsulatus (strain H88) TaxID=544711 RepID=A0A8A1LHQ9_AJEC8|nr:hypothetical protein I7I53_06598 [Histoplasma capsulatum var. duboisii H88]
MRGFSYKKQLLFPLRCLLTYLTSLCTSASAAVTATTQCSEAEHSVLAQILLMIVFLKPITKHARWLVGGWTQGQCNIRSVPPSSPSSERDIQVYR